MDLCIYSVAMLAMTAMLAMLAMLQRRPSVSSVHAGPAKRWPRWNKNGRKRTRMWVPRTIRPRMNQISKRAVTTMTVKVIEKVCDPVKNRDSSFYVIFYIGMRGRPARAANVLLGGF